MKLRSLLSLSALAVLGTAAAASAQTTLYGLTTGGSIVTVSSANPSVELATTSVTNLNAGETLFSIDFRPANGQLYGLGSNNSTGASSVYTINPLTGVATAIGTPGAIALGTGGSPIADFNPMADRLRVVTGFGGTGSGNFRVNQLDGTLAGTDTALAYATGDAGFGSTPNVHALSYSNAFAGAASTLLYGVDVSRRTLVLMGSTGGSVGAPGSPNGGQLFTVGSLGIFFQSNSIGFEILGNGQAFLVGAASLPSFMEPEGNIANSLFSINLATGAATRIGGFATNTGASFISLTAAPVPEPSTVALVAAAGALGVARVIRRRRQA